MAIQINGDSGISGVNGSAGTPALQGTDSNTGIVFGTDTVQISTGGTARATVDSSGNVKIGTGADRTSLLTASTANLQVDGGIVFEPGSGNDAEIFNYRGTSMKFGTSGAERLRIDSSGNVGIGNTTCGSILDVRTGATGSQNAITMGYGRSANPTDAIHKISWASDDLVIQADTGNTITSNIIFKNDNTERVRIDSSGNVGIGTSSPAANAKLDVNGSVSISPNTAGKETFRFSTNAVDDGRLLIKSNTTTKVDIQANGASYFNGGNVGIGTTSPGANLEIKAASIPAIRLNQADTYYAPIKLVGNDLEIRGSSGTIEFYNGANNGDSSTEKMRIDSSGNVGIGTTSPVSSLTVVANSGAGGLDINGRSSDGIGQINLLANNGTTLHSRIQASSSSTWIGSSSTLEFATGGSFTERMRIHSGGQVEFKNGSFANNVDCVMANGGTMEIGAQSTIKFRIGTNEKVRIDSNGNVGIGDTSPGGRLDIGFNSSSVVGLVLSNAGTGTSARFYSGSSIVGSITVSGSATAFNTSSDYRLKENVVGITDGITRVKQLSPSRFNFIADDTTTVDGFIAHEAQTVVPEAVTGEKDGKEMQGIDQSKLVPLLTAALQEAIAKIETLEARVTTLEAG